MKKTDEQKSKELMDFLHEKVFDPILNSNDYSNDLKQGVRLTIIRMGKLSAESKLKYYWSCIVGTDSSLSFAGKLKKQQATRFEDVLEEFRVKFDDKWLRS